jgi:hypothetical protein
MDWLVAFVPLAAGLGLLLAAAGLLAALLRLESAIAFLLATFLFAWTIAVTCTLGLSPFHAVRPATTWGWLVAVVVVASICWRSGGRPLPPFVGFSASARAALGDAKVRVLAVVVAIGCAYITALAVATPDNEGDDLAYHVARAAFWHQHRAVSYIGNAIDTRLNVNPPNAEIGDLFTMLASGTQRFVGLTQVGALLACVLATAGIARRIGAAPAPAAWAALLVVTFPVIATQAWTAENDLVAAAFLACSAFFLLGRTRSEPILAGLALALAIGTKFTGVLSIPLLLVLLAAAPAAKRLVKAAWLLGIGAAGGSAWYLVNFSQTHHLDGGLARGAAQTPGSIHVVVNTLIRFSLDSFDLSGLSRLELSLNSTVGLGVLLLGLVIVVTRRGRTSGWWICCVGPPIAATPGVIDLTYRQLYPLVLAHVSRLAASPNRLAGATPSWFGPLGVIGVAAGIAVAIRAVRRHGVPRVALVLALAPVILMTVLAFTIVWDPSRGRFMIVAFVLTGAAWSLMLPHRELAWTVTGIACLTLVSVLLNAQSKPSGVRILNTPPPSGIWGKPDWWVQSVLRPRGYSDYSSQQAVLRYADERLPSDASLAVATRINDFLSPYFGPKLTRHVTLVLSGDSVDRGARWLIAAPHVRPTVCGRDWRVILRTRDGWLVAKKVRSSTDCRKVTRIGVRGDTSA